MPPDYFPELAAIRPAPINTGIPNGPSAAAIGAAEASAPPAVPAVAASPVVPAAEATTGAARADEPITACAAPGAKVPPVDAASSAIPAACGAEIAAVGAAVNAAHLLATLSVIAVPILPAASEPIALLKTLGASCWVNPGCSACGCGAGTPGS